MEFKFAKYIAEFLNQGIEDNYEAGLKDVLKLPKSNRLRKFDDTFKIDYTKIDERALRMFKLEAFTVAYIGNYELEEKLKSLAIEIWQSGQDFAQFEPAARRLMLDYIPVEEQPPSGWLETNLNTAVNSSYKAAEWNGLQRPEMRELYPAYEYFTQDDDVVRPEHAELHGKVFRATDPIWNVIWPPNGWNCRCFTQPVDMDEYDDDEAENLTENEQGEITGFVHPDFRRNSGQLGSIWGKWLKSQLDKMPKDVWAQIKEQVEAYAKTL